MPIFGAHQGESQSNLPVEQVRNMQSQGMDNNQIIQALQRDGYSSTDIFDAMNQADMVSASPQTGMPAGIPPTPPEEYGQAPPTQGGDFMSNHQLPVGLPQESNVYPSDSSTEELVEAIIDEKWNELVKDLNKVIEWKNSTTSKLVSLDQKFIDLKSQFDKLHSAIISKVEDYDKNITNVGAEVKAMEKVFSKVLPVFTENIAELSKITKTIKKSSGKN